MPAQSASVLFGGAAGAGAGFWVAEEGAIFGIEGLGFGFWAASWGLLVGWKRREAEVVSTGIRMRERRAKSTSIQLLLLRSRLIGWHVGLGALLEDDGSAGNGARGLGGGIEQIGVQGRQPPAFGLG